MLTALNIVKDRGFFPMRLSPISYLCTEMKVRFSKYQGTGNDFIMLDNFSGQYDNLFIEQIAFLCDRKLGIGADGLIKLSSHPEFDFELEYYNSDGSQSFCGNGARCSMSFAHKLGTISEEADFCAIDGHHKATIRNGIVRLEMLPVDKMSRIDGDYVLDTGSPHYVHMAEGAELNIVEFGKLVRYSKRYQENGINVNFLFEEDENSIYVETYERGVEDETLSCGTGVTAAALVYMVRHDLEVGQVLVRTKGGNLVVEADRTEENTFTNIWLSGPAQLVFSGEIDV